VVTSCYVECEDILQRRHMPSPGVA
jgi:hypothetical protein